MNLLDLNESLQQQLNVTDQSTVWGHTHHAQQFRQIAIEHRDVGHKWDFTYERTKLLIKYLYANYELVKFLRISNVPDRSVIENRLFLITA